MDRSVPGALGRSQRRAGALVQAPHHHRLAPPLADARLERALIVGGIGPDPARTAPEQPRHAPRVGDLRQRDRDPPEPHERRRLWRRLARREPAESPETRPVVQRLRRRHIGKIVPEPKKKRLQKAERRPAPLAGRSRRGGPRKPIVKTRLVDRIRQVVEPAAPLRPGERHTLLTDHTTSRQSLHDPDENSIMSEADPQPRTGPNRHKQEGCLVSEPSPLLAVSTGPPQRSATSSPAVVTTYTVPSATTGGTPERLEMGTLAPAAPVAGSKLRRAPSELVRSSRPPASTGPP